MKKTKEQYFKQWEGMTYSNLIFNFCMKHSLTEYEVEELMIFVDYIIYNEKQKKKGK